MLEKPALSEKQLQAFFEQEYNLTVASFDALLQGLDNAASVYRVVGQDGTTYALKVRSGQLYEPGCIVPRYLKDQGIAAVVAPLPNSQGRLWTTMERWTLIVYPFYDGDTSWTGMTDGQWRTVGTTFKRIHQIQLPSHGFAGLRAETFDPAGYVHWARDFETQHMQVYNTGATAERTLCASWQASQPTIHHALSMLEQLSVELRQRNLPYVICHADLHPANLLRDRAGQVYVIDWDDVMLAPRERDFILVDIPFARSIDVTKGPFFQGYGAIEVDWTALSYYRYERAVQDLIACAQDVCFRTDLAEGIKAEAVQLFNNVLAHDGELAMAEETASHLPSAPDV